MRDAGAILVTRLDVETDIRYSLQPLQPLQSTAFSLQPTGYLVESLSI